MGGRPRSLSTMSNFSDVLTSSGLQDLQGKAPFTWFNKRMKGGAIFERLDRFISNTRWQVLFPNFEY